MLLQGVYRCTFYAQGKAAATGLTLLANPVGVLMT
jgi:hypothetical protein